jgi:hypothetical protein
MATIAELEIAGRLSKLDPALDPDEQELRLLHMSEKLAKWLQEVLPTLVPTEWLTELTPAQQLDALIADYAAGLPLVFGKQFKPFESKPLKSIGDGVWYLKTTDIRIFGWFRARDCFVGVVPDTAERTKLYGLYEGYRGEVVRFRDALPLDEPKFIPGDDPDAVVSNYTFA